MLGIRQLGATAAVVLAACAGRPPATTPDAARSVSVPPEPSAKASVAEPTAARPTPGARELVTELVRAEGIPEREVRWQECRRLLDAIRRLADPRGADALAAYVANGSGWPDAAERVHRRTLAAFALAEIADLRALPVLAARLALDPVDVYRGDDLQEAQLRRSDSERITAARLIGDLATLHPGEHERIRKEAQEPVRAWLESGPAPHANGLRALARMRVQDESLKRRLRAWADPPGPLPKPGAQPPFEEKWAIALPALRYVGALKSDADWPLLEKQLARRPKNLDATMDALAGSGNALLGMTVRALAVGAASGFAEWGDPRAVPLLLKHIEDDKQNEQSRQEACRALAFSLDSRSEPEVTSRLRKWKSGADKRTRQRLTCLLDVLRLHPVETATPLLVELTVSTADVELRLAAARALGDAGLDSAVEEQLSSRLGRTEAGLAAAIALLLGGSADGARRAVDAYAREADGADLSALEEQYSRSLDATSEVYLDDGRLFRFVRNALASTSVLRGNKPVDFAMRRLGRHLSDSEYDSGPRSSTRVLSRKRLFDLAKSGSAERRASAVDTLALLRERGVLLALAEGSDPLANRAAEAAALLEPEPTR